MERHSQPTYHTKESKLKAKTKPTILKLGGSVITEKEKPLTPNYKAIKRLSREIKESNIKKLVIVHGGGSFGHPIAKKYDISSGLKNEKQLLGFSETHMAMVELNKIIIESLLGEGVPAVPISPLSFIINKSGRIWKIDLEIIRRLLDMDFVPVLYGDTVLDTDLGFTILSGDQIASKLAIELKAERLIFGVDVDGIFTGDPKLDPSAKLIENLKLGKIEKLNLDFGVRGFDVTGGMHGKFMEAFEAVKCGVKVFVVNARKPNLIKNALMGLPVRGTLIEF